MTIQAVQTSNTFNEFREVTNQVINQVNRLSDGTGDLVIDTLSANTFTGSNIVVNTITANTYVGVSTTLPISADTGNDIVSLTTETLKFTGSNGIATSIVSSTNTVSVNLQATGVTAGTYGSASKVPVLVVNAQGRVTSASNVSVAGVSNYQYYSSNANFVINTADGGAFSASIGQHLGTAASVTFQNLTVTGNVAFTGNVVTVTANNLVVEDNIIQLAKDNLTDIVDIGFIGHYYNSANLHAGFFRDATDGTWKTFQNYPIEPAANANIDTSNASFQFANFKAHNIEANGIFIGVGSGLTTLNASNVSSGTLDNARTTAASANGASTIVVRDANGSFSANAITATTFTGSGASLSSINATSITTGTVGTARLASGTANTNTYLRGDQTWSAIPGGQTSGSTTVGYLNYNGTTSQAGQIDGGTSVPDGTTRLNYNGYFYATRFYGDGSNVILLNANNISSGTISNTRTTANTSNSASTIVLRDANGSFSANVITAITFSGNADASIITSGTIATARLASGTANTTTFLRGDQTWAVAGATVTNDTSSNFTVYPALSPVTTGSMTTVYTSSTKLYFNPSTGTLSATNLNSLSDLRLKDDVQIIENAVSTISKIHGVQFKWKENDRKSYGVIAQELEKILPELVEGEDVKTVNYSGLIAFLINAVKELDDRLKKLES